MKLLWFLALVSPVFAADGYDKGDLGSIDDLIMMTEGKDESLPFYI